MARIALLPMLALSVLATGCCLPPLSGRCEPPASGMRKPPADNPPIASAKALDSLDGRRRGPHLGHRFGWHGFGDGPETPPGQHVPLPRFHPVPVRPVFEPQYDYSLPLSHGPNLAPIVTPESLGVPAPAKPVPDPA